MFWLRRVLSCPPPQGFNSFKSMSCVKNPLKLLLYIRPLELTVYFSNVGPGPSPSFLPLGRSFRTRGLLTCSLTLTWERPCGMPGSLSFGVLPPRRSCVLRFFDAPRVSRAQDSFYINSGALKSSGSSRSFECEPQPALGRGFEFASKHLGAGH